MMLEVAGGIIIAVIVLFIIVVVVGLVQMRSERLASYARYDAERRLKTEPVPENEKLLQEWRINSGLTLAEQNDEYHNSSLLSSISENLCESDQFERASKLIELIEIDFLREQAMVLLEEKKQLSKI